jgi:hypothetical protein
MHSDAGNFGSKGQFSVWEAHLASRLGVNRRTIADLRTKHLVAGLHFVKNGRHLLYSALGVSQLAAFIANGHPPEKTLPASVLSEPVPSPALFKFSVRRKAQNTHVLECADADGKIVVVRVRDSGKFVPGMQVEAVPYGAMPDVFEFAGAYPRFRGKY